MKTGKRKNLIYYFVLFLAGLLTINLYACKPSREDNDLQSEHANSYLTEDELAGYEVWEEKESFEQIHHGLLEEADSRIVALETYTRNADAQAQIEIRQAIENVKQNRDLLEAKLAELKQTKDESWKQAKLEVDQAADSLKVSFEKIPIKGDWGA